MSVRPITVKLRTSRDKSKPAITQGGRGAAVGEDAVNCEVQAVDSVGCRGVPGEPGAAGMALLMKSWEAGEEQRTPGRQISEQRSTWGFWGDCQEGKVCPNLTFTFSVIQVYSWNSFIRQILHFLHSVEVELVTLVKINYSWCPSRLCM